MLAPPPLVPPPTRLARVRVRLQIIWIWGGGDTGDAGDGGDGGVLNILYKRGLAFVQLPQHPRFTTTPRTRPMTNLLRVAPSPSPSYWNCLLTSKSIPRPPCGQPLAVPIGRHWTRYGRHYGRHDDSVFTLLLPPTWESGHACMEDDVIVC